MPPQKVNQKALVQMYRAGMLLSDICKYLGCARSTAKANLTRLGVERRPKGWKHKRTAGLLSLRRAEQVARKKATAATTGARIKHWIVPSVRTGPKFEHE